MNRSMIRYILSYVLKIEAILLLLPALVAAWYREQEGVWYCAVAVFCMAVALVMSIKKPKSHVFYLKEGCIATALSWLLLSLFGCLPFLLTGEIPQFADALFETISGFTTTGASILTDVEELSRSSLFWRSFTHWIGGMGVLVFLLAIIPMTGGSNINLMRAESPGPSVGKLVPKMRHTARILYLIYLGMTLAEIILLLAGSMPFFDAVTTSFGTAGTGGFGIRNSSMAEYSAYLQWVVTIFMILFGVNFNAYYLLLIRDAKRAWKMEEVRWYLVIILASIAIVFCSILESVGSVFHALTQSAFQVASIITTTGFSTVDFDAWPQISRSILVLLMFIGACAGSTGGGIKVSRIAVLVKTMRRSLHLYIHPKSVRTIKLDGKTLEEAEVRSISAYFVTFVMVFVVSVLLISLEDRDLTTNFTAVAATINNIGPGLSLVGPSKNFSLFSTFSKYVLMFDMLAGRLELFPLLLLFHPKAWRELFGKR